MSINSLLPLLLSGSLGQSQSLATASSQSNILGQLSGMFSLANANSSGYDINQNASVINNIFIGQLLGVGGGLPIAQPQPQPILGGLSGGLDLTSLLLLMLLCNGKHNTGNPILDLLTTIVRPVNPGVDGPGGSGWGDPHFNLPWVKAQGWVDFHGKGLTANGGVAAYRAYDNGKSAINMVFQGKDGEPTIINEVGGKVGKDLEFHFDADTNKLIVNGKELKRGESVRATGTGVVTPNGQEAAGWIMLDNSGKVIVNTGDAQFDWKKEGVWQGLNYLNMNYKVTEAGTAAVKNAQGKANALGGIFGSSISTGRDAFKDIAKKSQAEINDILDKALRLTGVNDFGGQKLLQGQAATQDYGYGTNALLAATATA